MNLIRYINISGYNIMTRRMIANIGIDFAIKIMGDFDLRLGDFVDLDNY
jgi:hypothetical protein